MATNESSPARPLRIIGLSEQPLRVSEGRVYGKGSGLYNALASLYDLKDVISVRLPTPRKLFYLARHFRRQRARWRAAASINPEAFLYRTALARQRLAALAGQYDLIFQLHTLTAPGSFPPERPFVLATDNTFMLSEQYWPDWVPVKNRRARERWIALEREVYQQAAYVFPWSEFTRRSMLDDYGLNPDKVIVVGAGTDLHLDRLDDKRYDTPVALFVGIEFERKGGPTLLAAWRQVTAQLPDARLLIAGPRHPLPDLPPGVTWLGYISDTQQLKACFDRASVFVMPSVFEPFGYVFVEAMSRGLACIGADRCAMPEIIRHGRTGLLVPVGDADALAEALVALLGDPDRAAMMGRQAHHVAAQEYTWPGIVAQMQPYIDRAGGRA